MATPPKGKPTGIDVSQYQATLPLRSSDKFVVIRLSSGDGGLHYDTRTAAHVLAAKQARVPFALYHYLGHAGGAVEAEFAVARMSALDLWGHKLVCDFEGDSNVDDARAFISTAKRLLRPSLRIFAKRRRVGLYSGNVIKENGGGTLGADFGWLADYNAFDKPSGWSDRFTKLWQYDSYTTDRGHLDLDIFLGYNVGRFFAPINSKGYRTR